MFSYEKLPGLPRERVFDAIEPVLRARGLVGVELVWTTENGGKVLRITVEETCAEERTAAGVSLEACAQVSREVSAALDGADVIPGKYHLEVGTPGLERLLYTPRDFERFTGQLAQLKLSVPLHHEYSVTGRLCGLSESDEIRFEVNGEEHLVPFDNIRTSQLVIDWNQSGVSSPRPKGRMASGRR